MKGLFVFLFLLLSVIVCTSCRNFQKEDNVALKWIGNEIIFPEHIEFTVVGSDSMILHDLNKKYKVLVYINDTGCFPCKMKMNLWKDLIKLYEAKASNNIVFIFVFNSHNYNEINYLLKDFEFKYPVCFDKTNTFDKLNNFENDVNFQTFLLDANNCVLVVGNPSLNKEISELYLDNIEL